MSILDDGSLAEAIADGMREAIFYAVTLHKRGAGYDANGVPNGITRDVPLSGFVDTYSAYRRQESGIPDTDAKIMILQHGASAAPAQGDEITALGCRYEIMRVGQDPAAATWELQARRR